MKSEKKKIVKDLGELHPAQYLGYYPDPNPSKGKSLSMTHSKSAAVSSSI